MMGILARGRTTGLLIGALVVAFGCAEVEVQNDGTDTLDVGADELSWELAVETSKTVELEIENKGAAEIELEFDHGAPWLEFEPENRSLGAGERVQIAATASCGEESGEFFETVAVIGGDTSKDVEASLVCEASPVGELQVDILGLGDDRQADVTVHHESGFEVALTETTLVEDVPPGIVEVSAGPIDDDGAVYEPDPPETTVDVEEGDVAEVTVSYEAIVGALQIEVEGLPDELEPELTLFREGQQWDVPADGVVEALEPGVYTVMAEDVEDGGTTWGAPSPDAIVRSDQTETVTVSYIADPGGLQVDAATYGDADFQVAIAGPDGFDESIDGDADLSGLVPGEYAMSIEEVPVDADGNEGWVEIAPEDTVEVASGEVQTVTISAGQALLVATEEDDGPGSLRHIAEGPAASAGTVTFHDDVETIDVASAPITVDDLLDISGDDDASIIIEGDGNRIFSVESGAFLALEGVTLKNGDASGHGGAVRLQDDASLIAARVVFEQNQADGMGGALFVDFGAEALLEETIFRDNSSNSGLGGGAIGLLDGTVDVETSLFENNTAWDGGGAIYVDGDATIGESTFVNNEAQGGYGGAINADFGTAVIRGATIVDNAADASSGGGIYYYGDSLIELTLSRSVIASNSADEGPDVARTSDNEDIVSLGYNVVGIGGGGLDDGVGGDQIGTGSAPLNPLLGDLDDNGGFSETMSPGSDSPAYASVPADECENLHDGALPVRDQRRQRRPAGAFCNAGAYELDASLETFSDADMASNVYEDGNYIGDDGVQWFYEEVRREDGSYAIEDTSVILRDDPAGSLQTEQLSGGIDSLSFQMAKAFTASSDRQLEVLVDGDLVATTDSFDEDGDTPYPVYRFSVDNIDVTGDFDIEIRSVGDGQITVDNVTWR